MDPSDAERRGEIDGYFIPENETAEEPLEEPSPSGRYRLVIRSYGTRPGCWSYTRGTVHRVADGAIVCDIKRNFSTFHHTFVVRLGEEWLICGRSYMSQTIVNLETGAEYEPPGTAYDSMAFCWSAAYLSPDGKTLAVDGCHWACPYEYRFFDFTDPARGWAALPIEPEDCIEVEGERPPVWLDQYTFECYGMAAGELSSRTRLHREGNRMHVVERWISEAEQRRRDEVALAQAAFEAWRTDYVRSDPLFLEMKRLLAEHGLPDDGYVAWGETDGQRAVHKYIRRKEPRASADLSWGVERGPLTVRLYDEHGMRAEDVELERGREGMHRALELIAARFARSS